MNGLRIVYGCLILIFLGFISGCWDRDEMDDLALVMASGMDRTEDGQLELTLQIALPTGIPSALQSGGGGAPKPVLVVSAKGKSGHDALKHLQDQISREFYFGFRGILVYGEDYAREGIDQVLDTLLRNPDSRYISYMLTAQGATAKEILNIPYQLENIPAIGMRKLQYGGFGLAVKIDNFLDALASNGKSPATGAIRIVNKGTDQESFKIDHAAVYKENKLVGFLEQKEVDTLRWMEGENPVTRLNTQIEPKQEQYGGTITISLLQVNTKIQTTMKKDIPEVSLTFKARARTLENDTRLNMSKADNLQRIETKFEKDVEELFTSTISRVQKEMKADVFGFGNQVHIDHPYVWKEIKDQWPAIYPKVPVTVKVDITIARTGRTQEPAHMSK